MLFGPGNPLAFAALLLFPVLAIAVLMTARGRPAGPVTALVLGGAMFLPQGVSIDPPGLPAFDKEMIIYLGVTLGMLASRSRMLFAARPGTGLEALVFAMILGSFGTTATNPDVLTYGPTVLVGMPWYDTATGTLIDLMRYAIPYFLGRCAVRDARDLERVLQILAVAGLGYSLLLLTEIRLSPQLHNWVYGFHQNQFAKAVRYGGYRPMVFMDSGIAVGVFMATTLVAAATLARRRIALQLFLVRVSARLSSLYLGVVLVLCKSVAAAVEGIALALVITFASLRNAMRVAVLMAALALSYPVVRIADWMPLEQIVAISDALDPARAKSLNFRFESEEQMLAKARERFVFGWGGYRRAWVFDPETGDNLTVPDGYWIIQLGGRGLVGFLTAYALYTIPVFRAARALRRVPSERDRTLLVGLALVVAMRGFDQLVNGFYSSYPLFLAGALAQPSLAARAARQRSERAAAGAAVTDAVGVVAIGRNEGERLVRCLHSLAGRADAIVYVDSGSSDGSPARARSLGADVVELDPALPFSAARARNEGFARLEALLPGLAWVQFIDGDCELQPGWIPAALAFARAHPDVAVVCGRRRERDPGASPWNRLVDFEWDRPPGDTDACGGDALMRAASFRAVGGYDASRIAGEDPELCLRVRRQGGRIVRLANEMTLHDVALHHAGAWWRRQVRSGHAYAEAALRRDRDPHAVRRLASIAAWGGALPAAAIALALATRGAGLALALAWAWPWWRAYSDGRRRWPVRDAALYASGCTAGKLAECEGALRYAWNHGLRGRATGLIEYKDP